MKNIIYLFLAAIVFTAVGYYYSDHRQFKRLISENNLKTPLDVYKYLGVVKPLKPDSTTGVIRNCTPYYSLTKRPALWCDEGAIVMATFDQILGYETRLVDIYGLDTVSHHTILEVFENNQWTLYDRRYDNFHVQPHQTVNYTVLKTVEKQYPKPYNFFVNRNFFIKKLALILRGVKEEYSPTYYPKIRYK